ncbi:hypothetical protein PInf_002549 [Phytophthora infestans]|nr:hypothetical protein PInf_002549 [Phytophthora infestans]
MGTRGSTPREDAAAVPEEERGTNHFRIIWPEFKKMGWTSNTPAYSRNRDATEVHSAGGNTSDTVGIDFVHGEQAVVDNAMTSKVCASSQL